jgi:transcription-repair coupling factor (superfamily II helicase)
MQKLMAAGSAHIAEHLGMEMRKQIEQTMGQTLPPYNEDADEVDMSPEMEVQVSQMAAQASQQLLQQHQQEAQQKKNKQMQEDPLIQLQQQELQLKAQENQRRAAKDQSDAMLKQAQLQIERERINAQQETEGVKIAMKAQADKQQRDHTHEQAGFTTGMDMQKHQLMLASQREIAQMQAENRARQQRPKKGD